MAPVAERGILGLFARAPGHGLGFANLHLARAQPGAFVGAVAKGLGFRPSARAPVIGASLGFLDDGELLKGNGLTHNFVGHNVARIDGQSIRAK